MPDLVSDSPQALARAVTGVTGCFSRLLDDSIIIAVLSWRAAATDSQAAGRQETFAMMRNAKYGARLKTKIAIL
jgi:hypothetical protein